MLRPAERPPRRPRRPAPLESDDAEAAQEARHGAAVVEEQRGRLGLDLAPGLGGIHRGFNNPDVPSVIYKDRERDSHPSRSLPAVKTSPHIEGLVATPSMHAARCTRSL